MVTGGKIYNDGYTDLDSTEIMERETEEWRQTAPLPSARSGLRAAVLDNKILLFGKNILSYINIEHLTVSYNVYNDHIFTGGYDGNDLKNILRYNKNHTWENVGQMKEARGYHAVVVLEDVSQLCP